MQYIITVALLTLPALSLAAVTAPKNFKDFVNIIVDLNQTLVSLIFALTFIVLAWTIVNTWIIKGGDEAEVEKGKKVITIGIIVLIIMSGIWGILALLRAGLFGLH